MMNTNAGRSHHSRRACALLAASVLGSCVAGSEGPHGPGTPSDPPPGLIADLFAGPIEVPDQIAVDSILELTVAVHNGGTRVVDAGWVIRVMLSTDAVIDSADIQVDHFGAPRVLQPGAEDRYLRHKKLSATTPTGLYYIGSILDVTGRVPEASESNNVQQSPARITLTAESPPAAGDD